MFNTVDEKKYRSDALLLRRQVAIDSSKKFLFNFDKGIEFNKVQNSFFKYLLEREPFENTLEKICFSILITEKSIKQVLDSSINIYKKISLVNYLVEVGSREFISPYNINAIDKNLTAAKATGFFFTPISLACNMVELSKNNHIDSVIDPACGTGVLLAAAVLKHQNIKLIRGIEIDKLTSSVAEELIFSVCKEIGKKPKIEIINDDFLSFSKEILEDKYEKFDLLVMNPPYGRVRFLQSSLSNTETKSGLKEENSFSLLTKLRDETKVKASILRKQFSKIGLEKGTPEYSKIFLGISTHLVNDHGNVIAITPSSWLTDESGNGLRKYIFNNHSITDIWSFNETAKLFHGVNQPTTVIKLAIKKSIPVVSIKNKLNSIIDINNEPIRLNIETIKDITHSTYRIPICDNTRLKILTKLHRRKVLSEYKQVINRRGELDLTKYKNLISNDTNHTRLVRGDHISKNHLKNVEESIKQGYVDFDAFIKTIGNNSTKLNHINSWRIAIPQCSYMQKTKRIEACIIPPKYIVSNSCNYLCLTNGDNQSSRSILVMLNAIMNSSIIEWRFRLFNNNNHVANYELAELPIFDFLSDNWLNQILKEELSKYNYNSSKIEAMIAVAYELSIDEIDIILMDLKNPLREQTLLEMHRILYDKENKFEGKTNTESYITKVI